MPLGYRRGLQTNPVNILCASPPVRRAETCGSAPAWAQWTQRAPEQSRHSAPGAECRDCSAGWLRQGAWPRAATQNSALRGAFQPSVHHLAATRMQQAYFGAGGRRRRVTFLRNGFVYIDFMVEQAPRNLS